MAFQGIDANHYKGFMEEAVIEATGNKSKQFLYNLWDEIVLYTPVVTGLAMFSWRLTPSNPSSYKPKLTSELIYNSDVGKGVVNSVRVFPEPERPNLEKYRRIYKKFVLFNNQEYVSKLNENENKYYYQFIDDGIRRAVEKSK